jgi:hypothetical protein
LEGISGTGIIVGKPSVNFRYVSTAIWTNIVIERNVSPTGITFVKLGVSDQAHISPPNNRKPEAIEPRQVEVGPG